LEERKRKRIRHLVDLYYDVQEVRKAANNRLREISENIEEARESDEIRIEDYTELERALNKYIEDHLNPKHLKDLEKEIKRRLDKELKTVEIYTEFLRNIKGISMTLGAGLLSRLDSHKAPYPSSFWKFCGMHPEGARGRSRGEKIGYNPWMKTHVWKVGDSFVKQRTPKYRSIYDCAKEEEREKLNDPISDPKNCPHYEECFEELKEKAERAGREPKSPSCRGHIDNRARRKMVKEFLKDFWVEWRSLEGLEVREPYHEAIQDSKREAKA